MLAGDGPVFADDRLDGMVLLRVDARPLLPGLRAELAGLLAGLSGADWERPTACPGWPVHGVAAHLLGVELGNVSARRDGWKLGPSSAGDLDAWLNGFNQQWVGAARRISPALLIELLDLAGRRFEEYVATLDLDAAGGPVEWATGSEPAPVWLDVAREYMERYVHQDQIRSATGRGRLGALFTWPVLETAAHALPRALDQVIRPAGTMVTFTAEGSGGGTWVVVRVPGGWSLSAEAAGGAGPASAACRVRTTVDGALKLYARDPAAPALSVDGDEELAAALGEVKAVLG
jgi:uncharacterized protein (TIGR03083 family)